MSTMTYNQPIYSRNKGITMKQPERTNLQEIIAKVRALQNLTKTTGFFTSRSVGALLGHLTPDELVEVAQALEMTPPETQQLK